MKKQLLIALNGLTMAIECRDLFFENAIKKIILRQKN